MSASSSSSCENCLFKSLIELNNAADINKKIGKTSESELLDLFEMAISRFNEPNVELVAVELSKAVTCRSFSSKNFYRNDAIIDKIKNIAVDLFRIDDKNTSLSLIKNNLAISFRIDGFDQILKTGDSNLISIYHHGIDVNKQTKEGKTFLHMAVESGNLEAVERLLELGANVNLYDGDCMAPLALAAIRGNVAIVDLLLKHGAAPNTRLVGNSLFFCLKDDKIKIAELLIQHGADLNLEGNCLLTPLFYAVSTGSLEIAKLLINHGADVNKCDKYGRPPLYMACHSGKTQFVELLFQSGAKLDKCGNFKHLLGSIIQYGNKELLELILKHGADVNLSYYHLSSFKTPLYHAVEVGNKELVELLLAYGANIHQSCPEDGDTPFHKASKLKNKEIMELFIQWQLDPSPFSQVLSAHQHN